MVHIPFTNATVLKQTEEKFSHGLESITIMESGTHKPPVCLTCDKLLVYKERFVLSKSRIMQLRNVLGSSKTATPLKKEVVDYYTYKGNGTNDGIKQLLLSPKGIFIPKEDGFLCCAECYSSFGNNVVPSRVRLPKFCICNGMAFGTAPKELSSLNEVELALLANARIDKHVFAIFGGGA